MLSYKSDTFQTARKDLDELNKTFQQQGNKLGIDDVKDFLAEKNISFDEFKNANKEFVKAGKKVRPEGFRLGRIVAGAVGEAGRDIKDFASTVAPKTTEAIGSAVSEAIPDKAEKNITAFFDPYMGEGLGAEVDRALADIGSYLVPGGVVAKGITKGSKLIKIGKGIGPKAAKLRKMGRLGKYAVAGSVGATIAESDIQNENLINVINDAANELGFNKMAGVLEKLATNPDDTKSKQYFDAFINNALLAGIIPAGSVLTKPLTRQKAIEKIVKRKKKVEKKTLQVDSTPTNLFGKIGRGLARGFRADRGTDAFTLEKILMRERAGKKALEEIEGLTQDLQRAVGKSGVNKSVVEENIQKVLELRDADALRFLKTNAPEVAEIVNKMTKNLKLMRRKIAKKVTNEDLKAIYDPVKKKVYLNRSYRIYDDPNFSKDIKDVPAHVRKDVEDFLRKQGIPEDELEGAIKELLARGRKGETDFKFADVFGGKTNWGSGTSKTYRRRTELAEKSPEVRALWGEVKDPYKNYAKTYEKLAQIESESSFVNDMAKYFRESGLGVTKEQLLKKGIIDNIDDYSLENVGKDSLGKVFGRTAVEDRLVPVVNKKTGKAEIVKTSPQILNPLKNLYVNPEYKKFIEEGTDILAPTNTLMKNWMRYKVTSQTAKTVYNPSTHGRNVLGNAILMIANGMNPLSKGKDSFKAAYKKLTGRTNEELGKRIGRYQELDIVDSGVNQETLRKAAGDVFNYESDKVIDKLGRAATGKGKGNPLKFTQNLYQVEDDFFKIMHFEKTLDDLKRIFPKGTPIDVIEKEAARRTRELMPNYGLVGKKLKELRYLPVGDFIAFPAEMIRVSYNLGRRTLKDITGQTADELGIKNKEARNELKNMGYRRLAGITMAGTAGEQIMGYTANRLGLTKEEIQAAENLGPSYERGSPKIFLSGVNKDKNNHYGIDYINMGPIDPFNYLKAPALLVGRELASIAQTGKLKTGTDININNLYSSPDFRGAFQQALGPFLGPSMATEAIIDALTLAEEDGMPFSRKISNISQGLLETIIPGGYTMYEKGAKYRKSKELRQNMFNSETGEKGRGAVTDFDYTIPEVEMEGFLGAARWFGIRGQRLDMTAGMRRQIFPLTRGMDQMPDTAAFMNNPNAPRAGEERNREYRKAYLQDQKRRLDYFKRLKRVTDAYDTLGLDYEDILSGLSKEFLKNINSKDTIKKMDYASRNEFLPSFIPKGLIPLAEEYTGGRLPYEDIGNIYKQLFNLQIYDEE
jgi:hypothetical protein